MNEILHDVLSSWKAFFVNKARWHRLFKTLVSFQETLENLQGFFGALRLKYREDLERKEENMRKEIKIFELPNGFTSNDGSLDFVVNPVDSARAIQGANHIPPREIGPTANLVAPVELSNGKQLELKSGQE